MNYNRSAVLGVAMLAILSSCNSSRNQTDRSETAGWVTIFNGENLDGWRTVESEELPQTGWIISNRELIVDTSTNGSIITRRKYSNFELEWEWKMLNKGGNSGIKYYVNSAGEPNPGLGLEYQILDDENHAWMLSGKMKPNDFFTAGACYELFAPGNNKKVSPLGEWNSSKIVSTKNRIEHWLNGEKIVEFDRFSDEFDQRVASSKFKDNEGFGKQDSGHILLQDHGGIVHFRNLRIKEL